MIQIKRFLNRKGQGIVEYAILLAVIVGLAVFLNDGSIGNAVQGAFGDMAALLSGEERQEQGQSGFVAYNKRGKNQLHDFTTGQDLVDDKLRIEADQQSLANIAEFFIGKTEAEVRAAIKDDGRNSDGVNILDYKDWTEESSYTEGNIKTGLSDSKDSTAVDRTNGRIYNWMQGDYGGTNGYNSDYDYDSGTRYLVSNYMIKPNEATPQGENAKWIDNRTVRVVLKYDGTGNSATVSEARVYVTRGERTKPNSGIRELDMTATKNSNGEIVSRQTTEGKGYYKFK